MTFHKTLLSAGLVLLVSTSCGTRDEPEPAPSLQLEPCRLKGYDQEISCARFEVFEDRKARTGRRIASSAEFVGSPKACAHISNGNKVPYSFVRRRIFQYPLRSDAYTRCPEPPPEAPFPIAHTSRHRGAQPRVKAGAAAELAREALRLGEHRGLLKRRWKTVLPTNSAEDPKNITQHCGHSGSEWQPGAGPAFHIGRWSGSGGHIVCSMGSIRLQEGSLRPRHRARGSAWHWEVQSIV